jgi:hypothetical protein
MSAPYRIESPDEKVLAAGDAFKQYLERLLKMLPAEIVGLYMIGTGFIPAEDIYWSFGWAGVCLILLLILRVYGTSDKRKGKHTQPVPVGIAAIAFVIWLFWMGGPFEQLHVPYRQRLASLAVLVWSFVIPIFYRGARSR